MDEDQRSQGAVHDACSGPVRSCFETDEVEGGPKRSSGGGRGGNVDDGRKEAEQYAARVIGEGEPPSRHHGDVALGAVADDTVRPQAFPEDGASIDRRQIERAGRPVGMAAGEEVHVPDLEPNGCGGSLVRPKPHRSLEDAAELEVAVSGKSHRPSTPSFEPGRQHAIHG